MLIRGIGKMFNVFRVITRNFAIFFLPRVDILGISFGNYDSRHTIFKTFIKIELPISDLISKDMSGNILSMKDSSHFKQAVFLISDNCMNISDEYAKEFGQRYPELHLEQEISSFRETFNFVLKNTDKQEILVRKHGVLNHKFEVIDGMHRAAILLVLGTTRIKCLVTR